MLSYSADVLISLLARYNAAIWPAQFAALLLGCALVALVLRPPRHAAKLTAAILVAAWLWTGAGFFLTWMAAIDFTAQAQGWLFVLEALLVAWSGLLRGRLALRFQPGLAGWSGLLLLLFGLFGYPLLAALSSGEWAAIPLFGLAPAPTLLVTLGLPLLAVGRPPVHLLLLPVLWSLATGWLAWALEMPLDFALPAAGLLVLGLALVLRVRGAPRRAAPPEAS